MYEIVAARELHGAGEESLEYKATKMVEDGWIPSGAPFFHNFKWYQAMYKLTRLPLIQPVLGATHDH